MRFIFIVQGEGRGHMTQAISLRDILIRNGHEVLEVLVGKSPNREIPGFFYEKIQVPVHTYHSPNFQVSNNNKGIKVYQSVLKNIIHLKTYIKSCRLIRDKIKELKPDVVINFYEMLAGLTYMVYNPKVPYICLGHQFLLLHPNFKFPKGHSTQIFMLNFLTKVTSFRATKRLGLSFDSMPDCPKKRLFVVPPLLRNEVLTRIASEGNYILGYVLNAGYSEEIVKWHQTKPQVVAHFFWDKKDVPEELEIEPNLFFHKLNDVKFLDYMQGCMAYSSTAGFESICEAMYLRKPILMVPTGGHIEQLCNSVDATRAGAGIAMDRFDLDKLLEYIPQYNKNDRSFVDWAQSAEKRFLELIKF
jgi:uncharacterized protein (TIGR00661 family)